MSKRSEIKDFMDEIDSKGFADVPLVHCQQNIEIEKYLLPVFV